MHASPDLSITLSRPLCQAATASHFEGLCRQIYGVVSVTTEVVSRCSHGGYIIQCRGGDI